MRSVAKRDLYTEVTTDTMAIQALGAFGKLNSTTNAQADALAKYCEKNGTPFKGIKDKFIKLHKEQKIYIKVGAKMKYPTLQELRDSGTLWIANVDRLTRNLNRRYTDYDIAKVKVELTEAEENAKERKKLISAFSLVIEELAGEGHIVKALQDAMKAVEDRG